MVEKEGSARAIKSPAMNRARAREREIVPRGQTLESLSSIRYSKTPQATIARAKLRAPSYIRLLSIIPYYGASQAAAISSFVRYTHLGYKCFSSSSFFFPPFLLPSHPSILLFLDDVVVPFFSFFFFSSSLAITPAFFYTARS